MVVKVWSIACTLVEYLLLVAQLARYSTYQNMSNLHVILHVNMHVAAVGCVTAQMTSFKEVFHC